MPYVIAASVFIAIVLLGIFVYDGPFLRPQPPSIFRPASEVRVGDLTVADLRAELEQYGDDQPVLILLPLDEPHEDHSYFSSLEYVGQHHSWMFDGSSQHAVLLGAKPVKPMHLPARA